MIFNFKNDLLFIKILNTLKQIACKYKLINYRNLKKVFDSQKRLKAVTRAPPSVPDILNYTIILRTIDLCSSIAKADF